MEQEGTVTNFVNQKEVFALERIQNEIMVDMSTVGVWKIVWVDLDVSLLVDVSFIVPLRGMMKRESFV